MTHRERVLAALARRQPDRVPLDLGATYASTIHLHAYARLRTHLGLPDEEPAVFSERGAIALPSEDVLRRFGIGAAPVTVGGPTERSRISADCYIDEWGIEWTRPPGGHYIATAGPFQKLADPSPLDIDRFGWPDPADPRRYAGLRDRAAAVRETGRAAILNFWVGPVHIAQFMRGFGEFLQDLLERPLFAEALMDRAAEFWVRVAERAFAEAGDLIDAAVFFDDLGTQRGPLLSPALYRRLIQPRHRRMADAVKRAGKPLIWHSCGSVARFIPHLIEIGVDALNPVQVSAAGMDTAVLKREFGKDLAFWGGIDTGSVLPRGTVAEVRDEVKRRIADLAGGGGYILCAVHNIQREVPPANIEAMYDAALEFGA